jgi:D-proline reductase (dithiol) PrdB
VLPARRANAKLITMTVDSYAFLPRAFRAIYEAAPQFDHEPVWASFDKPLGEARIGLLSSAGMFLAGAQEPFDVERERREPTWGDPTLRIIPNDVVQSQIDATHLHLNTADFLADMDVALPINRLNELAEAGEIGSAASEHYSVMGFQEDGAEVWRTTTGPEIAARCHAAEIDALILAPA